MKLFVLAVLFAVVCSANAFWSGCGVAGVVTPTSVSSPLCTATECNATRGQNLVATVVLAFPVSRNNLILTAWTTIAGQRVDLPITSPGDQACNAMTPGCPTGTATQTMALSIPISSTLPALQNLPVTFDLHEGATRAACFIATNVNLV